MAEYKNQPAFPFITQTLHKFAEPSLWDNLWFLALLAIVYPVYSAHLGFDHIRLYRYTVLGLMALGYLYMAFKICFLDGNSWRQLIGMGGCLLLIFAGCIASGTFSFLSTFLAVFSAKGIPFRKLCKGYFAFFCITMILNLILVYFGVLEDFSYERTEALGQGILRHSLGFGHPNNLGFWCLLMVFGCILAFPGRKSVLRYSILLLFTLVSFYFSNSKAFLMAAVVAMLLCILFHTLRQQLARVPHLDFIFAALVVLCAAAFVAATLIFSPDILWLKKTSDLFSMRIQMGNEAIQAMGLSLMGQQASYFEPVDSLMAYGPIWLGVIPSAMYLGLAAFSTFRAGRIGQWDIVAVSLASILYCTMEYGLINPVHMTLFAAMAALNSDKQ